MSVNNHEKIVRDDTDHVLSNLEVRVFSINSTTNNKGNGQS